MPSIIDIHPHVISTDTALYPLAPLGGRQSTWSHDRPAPFELLVGEMDRAGVHKAAIVQASTAYGHDNSYVAAAIAAHPKRFTGVFSVDVLAADAAEKMKFWLAGSAACVCSRPAAPCLAKPRGSTTRIRTRPGIALPRPASRCACR